MRLFLSILVLFLTNNIFGQQIFPTSFLPPGFEGSQRRILVNEYGVYSFNDFNGKTIVFRNSTFDSTSISIAVDTLDFSVKKYGITSSNDDRSALFLSRKESPQDSVILVLDSLLLFHLNDTFDISLDTIDIDFVDTTFGIQWLFSTFSEESCMIIPLNLTLDLRYSNVPDSVKLISINDKTIEMVPRPQVSISGSMLLTDSFFYSLYDLDYYKVRITTGEIFQSYFLDFTSESPVGEPASAYLRGNDIYMSVNIASNVIERNNVGLMSIRIDKFNLDLDLLATVSLYANEEVYNELGSDFSAGTLDNLYASEDGTVYQASYAVKDQKLFATVLNPDFSIQNSFSFDLDRALYLNQVYPDERDSILYVTAYEYLDGFRSDVDTIPLVYAIDYSVGGVSSGTLLPVTTNTSIRVYPNPASSWITVSCEPCEQDVSDLQTAIIFSSTGKIVSKSRVENGRVDVSVIQPGTYQMLFLKENGHPVGASTLIKN